MTHKTSKKRRDLFNILFVCLVIISFVYIVVRSATIPITHDEAITYQTSKLSWHSIIANDDVWHPANNHIINTILVKSFVFVFGGSEFVLRIPSLLGLLIFLSGVFFILQRFLDGWKLILGGALFAFNPLLVDLFSISRGYSLALGFFIWGLYCLLEFVNSRSVLLMAGVFGLFLLSALSNLSFLNMLIAASLMLYVLTVYDLWVSLKRIGSKRFYECFLMFVFCISISVIVISMMIPQVVAVKSVKSTYYGGHEGFMKDTLSTLVSSVLEYVNYPLLVLNIAELLVIVFCLIFVFMFVYSVVHKKQKNDFFWMCLFGIVSLVCIFLMDLLFDSGFPMGRAAVFFIPVFGLLFFMMWSELCSVLKRKCLVVDVVFLVLCVLVIVHFFVSLNVSYIAYAKYDSSTKQILVDLSELESCRAVDCVRLGIGWEFEPSINYYRERGYDWIENVHRLGYDSGYDYYYVDWDDKEKLEELGVEIVKSYDISETYLGRISN